MWNCVYAKPGYLQPPPATSSHTAMRTTRISTKLPIIIIHCTNRTVYSLHYNFIMAVVCTTFILEHFMCGTDAHTTHQIIIFWYWLNSHRLLYYWLFTCVSECVCAFGFFTVSFVSSLRLDVFTLSGHSLAWHRAMRDIQNFIWYVNVPSILCVRCMFRWHESRLDSLAANSKCKFFAKKNVWLTFRQWMKFQKKWNVNANDWRAILGNWNRYRERAWIGGIQWKEILKFRSHWRNHLPR